MNVLTVQMIVDEHDTVHTTITCAPGASFTDALAALRKCQAELEAQIANRSRCPFNPRGDDV